jgi:hypothetical protein
MMPNTHAQQAKEEIKKHGDVMEQAMKDADRHGEGQKVDPVPMPENGSHAHSQAAHLGSAHEHTKPAGNLPHGAAPGELREPPQEVSRVGKEHRKQ